MTAEPAVPVVQAPAGDSGRVKTRATGASSPAGERSAFTGRCIRRRPQKFRLARAAPGTPPTPRPGRPKSGRYQRFRRNLWRQVPSSP